MSNYCTRHCAKQRHVNLAPILHNTFKKTASRIQDLKVIQLKVSVPGFMPRIQIQVLSNFKAHVLFTAYSAAWFHTDLAPSSHAAFNSMTDLSSAESLSCMQNKGSCFLKLTLLFFPTALPWEFWVGHSFPSPSDYKKCPS